MLDTQEKQDVKDSLRHRWKKQMNTKAVIACALLSFANLSELHIKKIKSAVEDAIRWISVFGANYSTYFKLTTLTKLQVQGRLMSQIAKMRSRRDRFSNLTQELEEQRASEGDSFRAFDIWANYEMELSIVAQALLTMPASEASVERTFSAQGAIHTKKRNRLLDTTVQATMFVNFNHKAIKKLQRDDDDPTPTAKRVRRSKSKSRSRSVDNSDSESDADLSDSDIQECRVLDLDFIPFDEPTDDDDQSETDKIEVQEGEEEEEEEEEEESKSNSDSDSSDDDDEEEEEEEEIQDFEDIALETFLQAEPPAAAAAVIRTQSNIMKDNYAFIEKFVEKHNLIKVFLNKKGEFRVRWSEPLDLALGQEAKDSNMGGNSTKQLKVDISRYVKHQQLEQKHQLSLPGEMIIVSPAPAVEPVPYNPQI